MRPTVAPRRFSLPNVILAPTNSRNPDSNIRVSSRIGGVTRRWTNDLSTGSSGSRARIGGIADLPFWIVCASAAGKRGKPDLVGPWRHRQLRPKYRQTSHAPVRRGYDLQAAYLKFELKASGLAYTAIFCGNGQVRCWQATGCWFRFGQFHRALEPRRLLTAKAISSSLLSLDCAQARSRFPEEGRRAVCSAAQRSFRASPS